MSDAASEEIASGGAPACMPPAERRTAPAFAVPPDGCDCHTHVFGPYDRYPLGSPRSYSPPENAGPSLLGHLARLGLSRCVLVTATAQGTDNRAVLEALASAPGRLRGVAVVGEDTGDAELEAMHAAGVRGARVNLFRHAGISYRGGTGLGSLMALAPRLRALGWHAQIWIHVDDLPEVAPTLIGFGIDLVVDHMGRLHGDESVDRPGFRLVRRLLAEGKVWVKLSGADRNSRVGEPFEDVASIARSLVDTNPERLVWGSDWPHVAYFDRRTPDAVDLLDAFARWVPEPDLRHRILVENPAKLYGFPEVGARPFKAAGHGGA